MTEGNKEFLLKCHEKMAKSSFNATWDYLDKKERNDEDIHNMINAVHASRYHWGILVSEGKGDALNLQRAEWLLARVYVILEMSNAALIHANICLKITEDNNIGDFDKAFAYEALARASALTGNEKDFKKYFELAEKTGNEIKEKEDKIYFFEDFKGGNWFGMN